MNNPAERRCDMCNSPYILNARDIPRISISKRVDISELKSIEYIANPDYCINCFNSILTLLQRKHRLRFAVRKF